ncbi:MAG TPA: hypothetical protein VFT72_11540 [Opitutaceae bacterium]|nr:hypothetical protein [Opitutaceae bacterium]
MRLFTLYCAFCLCLVGGLLPRGAFAADQVAEKNLEPILIVGDHKLSAYLLDKYYHRFLSEQRDGGPPSPQANVTWLKQFLTNQVLIAEAKRQKIGLRPEIDSLVRRMERYMLTKPTGPYYNKLFISAYSAQPNGQADLWDFYNEHRMKGLKKARFVFNSKAAEKVAEGFWRFGDDYFERSKGDDVPDLGAVLFSYFRDGRRLEISAREFISQAASEFIRTTPNNVNAVRSVAEKLAMDDIDFIDAVRLGIANEAHFLEDKRGFADAQILELYERIELEPMCVVGENAIHAFYNAHLDQYVRNIKVKGRIIEATHFAGSNTVEGETILVSEVEPLDGQARITPVLLNSRIGTPIGPLKSGGREVYFVKDANVETVIATFAEVESEIRARLIKEELICAESKMARKLAGNFKIEDRIEYAKYSTTFEALELPWRK